MIQINGTIQLAPGTVAAKPEVVESIRALVRATRAEDGCIDYSFAQDLTDPDVLVLFERWRDADALAAHFGTPHMATFQQVMAENPPVGRSLRRYETDEGAPL